MRLDFFCHSLRSDWNNGNAHFLRGVVTELEARGHEARVYEPARGWSLTNLRARHGAEPLEELRRIYPRLESELYDPGRLDLDRLLDGADLIVVHEWNEPDLVRRLGEHRRANPAARLLFHDTHHRRVTEPETLSPGALDDYDGVLAFGESLRELYLRRGLARRAWTWHEAADVRVFRPRPGERARDLVWIGNWGDEERTRELMEFFVDPARELGLAAHAYGVRYPEEARRILVEAGVEPMGWVPNFRVPRVFAGFRATVHIPRRPYVAALPGIPTIRVFEALACGIPLVCAEWDDCERLFTPGSDYLVARSGDEMRRHLEALRDDPDLAAALAEHGLATIRARHTCAHRVDELLAIAARIGAARGASPARVRGRLPRSLRAGGEGREAIA